MDENFWIEMAKQVPSAIAVIGTVYLFLKAEDQREVRRIANAKEIGDVQRAHELQMESSRRGRELEINNLWASTVKNMMEKQDASNISIVDAIANMHKDLSEKYEMMGITKDLYDAAKKILKKDDR